MPVSVPAYYEDLAAQAREDAKTRPADEAGALLSKAQVLSQAAELMRKPGPRADDQAEGLRELIRDYEARAEAAYSAMYDARSYDVKDFKDDALFYLARAIELAEALEMAQDATRLRARSENISGVYGSQFRGVFR